MRVTLKLFASLAQHLPPGAERNAVEVEIEDGATVRALLDRYAVPLPACHLILVNGVFSPPAQTREAKLAAGDTVACWPPVAGG